jgi:hypothetical protein
LQLEAGIVRSKEEKFQLPGIRVLGSRKRQIALAAIQQGYCFRSCGSMSLMCRRLCVATWDLFSEYSMMARSRKSPVVDGNWKSLSVVSWPSGAILIALDCVATRWPFESSSA